MFISLNKNGNYMIHPKCKKSYKWDSKEETKFQKKMMCLLKEKRLPKSLEISWVEHFLEELKKMPEHEYSKKYDTFHSQHPLFF